MDEDSGHGILNCDAGTCCLHLQGEVCSLLYNKMKNFNWSWRAEI